MCRMTKAGCIIAHHRASRVVVLYKLLALFSSLFEVVGKIDLSDHSELVCRL